MGDTKPRAIVLALLILASCGDHHGPGEIEGKRITPEVLATRAAAERRTTTTLASRAKVDLDAKQILFGDLHVHSTFSMDAFMMGLPILQGEGTSPVANACDYARYCSALDFWAITDHAEGLTPLRWRETIGSIAQCNEIAGDPENPDLVAFAGWEWTQIGDRRENHYGHKNVLFEDYRPESLPKRPIHAGGTATQVMRQKVPFLQRYMLPLLDWSNRQVYYDIFKFREELAELEPCPAGVDTRQLSAECSEGAATPAELFEKLNQWGLDTLVIPHGTTWGIYTPLGSSWEKQLNPTQHDTEKQRLIEVFSGHGSSEEYRDWKEIDFDNDGNAICPPPQGAYEPCCWRAGEIIRKRCRDGASDDCERRVQKAQRDYLEGGISARLTVPGAQITDWQGCGSCPDCFQPAFNYRPRSSVQSIMALSNLDNPAEPLRFDFGFVASSDNHSARPGTGYKEYGRLQNTEARGPRDASWFERMVPRSQETPAEEPRSIAEIEVSAFERLDFERAASFFLTGGLVAVHAQGRSRHAIWQSLKRKEVYGTSGPRILLWFDLIDGSGNRLPMGSRATVSKRPRFQVRAAGSFKQDPGCPEESRSGLSAQRLDRLCNNECYNPRDERHLIKRIEVVRIRPQITPGERLRPLIEDPWLTLPCTASLAGCVVEFEDDELLSGGREALYYVRAIQQETPAVNAEGERCRYDAAGRCIEVRPCYGDYRTSAGDECLVATEERAWSSPIFVSPAPAAADDQARRR
ncbi:MAG TPA: DUF3604 domain-containing protein [Terriglobales bacterium]|nr:DUF3604 domain-containing protein [Terriglobales bacterium]